MKRLFKKIKTFFWYHKGPKEFISDDPFMVYVPDVVFERDVMLYFVKYNKDKDSYTVLVKPSEQGYLV